MVLDYTITIGNLIETGSIIGGGILALMQMSTKISVLHVDFDGVKEDIVDMKVEIKKVNDILVRMNAADLRIGRAEEDIRELRHGSGFVQGRKGVDREY